MDLDGLERLIVNPRARQGDSTALQRDDVGSCSWGSRLGSFLAVGRPTNGQRQPGEGSPMAKGRNGN
jgi:hypothetical protein